MKPGKVVLGIIAGAAAGVALGVLLAPEKGSNLRNKISKRGEGYLDNIKTMFDSFLDTLSESLESVKGDAEDLIEKGKSKSQEVKADANNAVNENFSSHR